MTAAPYIAELTFSRPPKLLKLERWMLKHGLFSAGFASIVYGLSQTTRIPVLGKFVFAPLGTLLRIGLALPLMVLSWVFKEVDKTLIMALSLLPLGLRRIFQGLRNGLGILYSLRVLAQKAADASNPLVKRFGKGLRFFVGAQTKGVVHEPPLFVRSQARWALAGIAGMILAGSVMAGGTVLGLAVAIPGLSFMAGIGSLNLGAWVVMFWSAILARNNLLKLAALDLAAGVEPLQMKKK